MIKLLETYFTTGYKAEDNKNAFDDLRMQDPAHPKELLPAFTARFRLTAE